MINQELARKWIAEMRKPENKKTIGTLKDDKGECCLGLYCRAVKRITPVRDERIVRHNELINIFRFLDKKYVLPKEIARELNITTKGSLTDLGQSILIKEYKNFDVKTIFTTDLTSWNDEIFTKDTNFLNMANIIEILVNHEASKGEECFEPYK